MTFLRNTRYGANDTPSARARWFATIVHHSICSAREIEVRGTLAHAWRRASQEFGDGFRDHEIVVSRIEPEGEAVPAARRLVKDRR